MSTSSPRRRPRSTSSSSAATTSMAAWPSRCARARKRLRLIQLFTAGYEGLQVHGVPPGVMVANAGDSRSPAVAEHAMAPLLALVKCLPHAILNQPRHAWDRTQTARMGSLEGQTLAIVGFGSIGHEFARRARALRHAHRRRRARANRDPLADEMQPISALNAVLGTRGRGARRVALLERLAPDDRRGTNSPR